MRVFAAWYLEVTSQQLAVVVNVWFRHRNIAESFMMLRATKWPESGLAGAREDALAAKKPVETLTDHRIMAISAL